MKDYFSNMVERKRGLETKCICIYDFLVNGRGERI